MNKTAANSKQLEDDFGGIDDVDIPPTKTRGRGRGRGRARGARGRGSRGGRGAAKASSSKNKEELNVTQKTLQSCKLWKLFSFFFNLQARGNPAGHKI